MRSILIIIALFVAEAVPARFVTLAVADRLTTSDQNFLGKKTFYKDESNKFKLGSEVFTGDGGWAYFAEGLVNTPNNATYSITNKNSGPNASCDWWISNDIQAGRLALGATSSGYSTHSIYRPDMTYIINDGDGGLAINSTPATEGSGIYLSTHNLQRMILSETGALTFYGSSGVLNGNRLSLDPNASTALNAIVSKAGTARALYYTNSNSNAFTQIDLQTDAANLGFGISSSGASSGVFLADGAYLSTGATNGLMLLASSGSAPIRFFAGGTTERMRIRANGVFNMPLPTYANDSAAGSGGLVKDDIFQQTGTGIVMIKQ